MTQRFVTDIVPGHALVDRGGPWLAGNCYRDRCATNVGQADRETVEITRGGPGHARCQCGRLSPHLRTNDQRRQWHRAHKGDVTRPETSTADPVTADVYSATAAVADAQAVGDRDDVIGAREALEAARLEAERAQQELEQQRAAAQAQLETDTPPEGVTGP